MALLRDTRLSARSAPMLLTSNQPAQSRGRERRRSHPEGPRVPARPLARGRPAPDRRPGSAPPVLAPDGPSAAVRPAVTPLHQGRTPRRRPHSRAPGSWRDLVARPTGRFPFEGPSGVHRESRHMPRVAHTVGHDGHAGRAECFRHTEQPERAPDVRRAHGARRTRARARHGSTPTRLYTRHGPTPNGWPYAGYAADRGRPPPRGGAPVRVGIRSGPPRAWRSRRARASRGSGRPRRSSRTAPSPVPA